MPRESRGVGHDYLVAEKAIVRDVRLRHDEAVVAGFCDPAATQRAAMYRHEFADSVAPSNFSFRRFAGKLQILWRQTNRDKREDLGFVANPGTAVDHRVAVDVHTVTQYDFIANYGIGTDAAVRADSGTGTDDCR
jgi:hypothetical protein